MLIVCASVCVGAVRYYVNADAMYQFALHNFVGEQVILHGRVKDEPEQKIKSVQVIVEAHSVDIGSSRIDIPPVRIMLTFGQYEEMEYGDRISIQGKLQVPGIINKGGADEFDYGAFLATRKVYYQMFRPGVLLREPDPTFRTYTARIQKYVNERIGILFPEPDGGLVAGVLIAGKGLLDEETLAVFRDAGIVHIVVLSGYNVALVALVILKAGARLHAYLRTVITVFLIAVFVFIAGADPSIVRAGIMGSLAAYAVVAGREYVPSHGLIVAVFCMLLFNPTYLYDPSFLLSCIATGALVFLVPIVEKKISDGRGRDIKVFLCTTFLVQLAVLPVIVYLTSSLSLVSFLANALVLFMIPLIMAGGAVAFVVSFFGYLFALPAVFVTIMFTRYVFFVAETLTRIPFATVSLPSTSRWAVIGIYGCILIWIYKTTPQTSLMRGVSTKSDCVPTSCSSTFPRRSSSSDF